MRARRILRALAPYLLLALVGGSLALSLWSRLEALGERDPIRWRDPAALILLAGCALLVWVGFHLHLRRAPTLAFSRVDAAARTRPGVIAHLAALPAVLRITAVGLIAVALARPQTFQAEQIEVEGIDIMIVLDLSRSMLERDLRRNRLDAGQRTIREFLTRRDSDRIGLVVFAQAAVTQAPLTLDYRALDQIVADLAIGDVPEMGTAIGDALALALASLRRSEARSKVVILLSDGDSNWTTKFDPREAKELARDMGVTVFTVLLGREDTSGTDRYGVDPVLLQEIARDTGGAYFHAGDDAALEAGFREVRETLEKTRMRVTGSVPDAELYHWFLLPALALLLLELLLRLTRWRRFP